MTLRGGADEKMETETIVLWPQSKEERQLPEAGKTGNRFSLIIFRGVRPYQHLDFGLLSSTTVKEYISIV